MANLTQEAQQFLRSTQRGILSTHSKKYSGYPFGSVAPYVVDHQGGLIILISDIAEHTKNIVQDPKVSMVVLADEQDMQANARLTLLGEASLMKAKTVKYSLNVIYATILRQKAILAPMILIFIALAFVMHAISLALAKWAGLKAIT